VSNGHCVLCGGKPKLHNNSDPLWPTHPSIQWIPREVGGGGSGSLEVNSRGLRLKFDLHIVMRLPSRRVQEQLYFTFRRTSILQVLNTCRSFLISLDLYLVACITDSMRNLSVLQIPRQQLTQLFTLFPKDDSWFDICRQLLYVVEITHAHFYIYPCIAWTQRISTAFIRIFSGYVFNCNLKVEVLIIFIVVFCHSITVVRKEQAAPHSCKE
jgi:hypothetical protein